MGAVTPYQRSAQRALFRRLADESEARYLQRSTDAEAKKEPTSTRRYLTGVRVIARVGSEFFRLGLVQVQALRQMIDAGRPLRFSEICPGHDMGKALPRMEAKGLVVRLEDGTREITQRGREILRSLYP